jgi:O-antigen/teichoic acid export membrane protein
MIKKFLSDGVNYLIPGVLSRGIAFLLLPIYTRTLSPDEYGSFELFMTFLAFATLTVPFEISQSVGRFLANAGSDCERAEIFSSAFWFTVSCYSVFSVVAISYSESFSTAIFRNSEMSSEFIIGIGYVYFYGIFYLTQNQLRWELRSKAYGVTALLLALISALTSLYLGYLEELGLYGILFGLFFGAFIGSLVGIWKLRNRIILNVNVKRLKEMLSFSFPLVFSGIFIWANLYSDRFLIEYFLGLDALGVYGVAVRLSAMTGLLMLGVQGAMMPLVYSNLNDPKTPYYVGHIFRFFLVIAATLVFFVSVFSFEIIRIMTTPKFFDAQIILPVMMVASLATNMYIFAPGLGIARKTTQIAAIGLVALSLNISLNIILIPKLGLLGAAVSGCVSGIAGFLLHVFSGRRWFNVRFRGWSAATTLAMTLLLIFSVKALEIDAVHLRAFLFLAGLAIIIKTSQVIGLITPEEFLAFRGYITRRRANAVDENR